MLFTPFHGDIWQVLGYLLAGHHQLFDQMFSIARQAISQQKNLLSTGGQLGWCQRLSTASESNLKQGNDSCQHIQRCARRPHAIPERPLAFGIAREGFKKLPSGKKERKPADLQQG